MYDSMSQAPAPALDSHGLTDDAEVMVQVLRVWVPSRCVGAVAVRDGSFHRIRACSGVRSAIKSNARGHLSNARRCLSTVVRYFRGAVERGTALALGWAMLMTTQVGG
jgi:hypothetical protein